MGLKQFCVVLVFTSILTGCGGSSGGGNADSPDADTTAPTVASVVPVVDAADVALDSALSVEFSEAVDCAGMVDKAALSLSDGSSMVAGTVSCSNNTATFNPESSLQYASTYTATISDEVVDLSGNKLAEAYSWSFTTIADTTAPTVTAVAPAADAADVAIDSALSVEFSEAVDCAGMVDTAAFSLFDGSSAIAGAVSCSNNTATFTPESSLNYETTYTATISDDVSDLSGNKLAEAYSWSFTTIEDSTPLAVSIADITVNETGVAQFVVAMNRTQDKDLTFGYRTQSDSAESGVDFVPTSGVVTIASGDTQATLSVPLIADALCESAESFSIVLNGSGFDVSANASITDVCDIDIDDDNLVEIYTLENLDWMRNDLAGASRTDNQGNRLTDGCATTCDGYELMADLDLDSNANGIVDAYDMFHNGWKGWQPIGDNNTPYTGRFNGNGHRISNLYIDRPDSNRIGLFGLVDTTSGSLEFSNVTLDGDLTSVTGGSYTGSLIGALYIGTDFTSAVVQGIDVSAQVAGFDSNGVGGIIGDINVTTTSTANLEMNGLSFAGKVTATGERAYYYGGLIGELDTSEKVDITLAACYADVSISMETESSAYEIGGLVGSWSSGGNVVTIENCHARGSITNSVSRSAYDHGGLIGDLSPGVYDGTLGSKVTIKGSSSLVDILIDTSGSNYYAGGFIGDLGFDLDDSSVTIENSFAAGDMSIARYAGGLIAHASYYNANKASLIISDSYSVGTVSGNKADETGMIIGDLYSRHESGTSSIDNLKISSVYFKNSETTLPIGSEDEFLTDASQLDNFTGATEAELRCPQSAADAGCGVTLYSDWDDTVWSFGDNETLPGLIDDAIIYRDNNIDGVYDF